MRHPPPGGYGSSPADGLSPEERPVKHPKHNDPTSDYPIDSDFISHFPVYVRYEPRIAAGIESSDDWNLAEVVISIFVGATTAPQLTAEFRGLTDSYQTIWLGTNYGKTYYLLNIPKPPVR